MNFSLIIKISLLLLVFNTTIFATTELATFESFYVESSYIGWIIAIVFAAIAGAVIFFTGGTASPIVIGIGTWIGNMAGLSGIAATNYGLALLGGGSMATGGLGVAGGVAILTATLTFSTDVIIDYTLGNVISSYNYSNFVKDSKNMLTLPIPQNEDGSDSYEIIVEDLKEKINKKESLHSDFNQKILLNQIKFHGLENNIKDLSLLSYLYFTTNDYKRAKIKAFESIYLARVKNIKRTLPAFIVATSSLYDKYVNIYTNNSDYFRYSVLAEPDNKLIPVMFAIYLDRVLYRMNDRVSWNYKIIDNIRDIAFEIKDEDVLNQSLVVIMMRYFIRIKLEQQKIVSLTNSNNTMIKNSDKTLIVVKESLTEYKKLLHSLSKIIYYEPIQDYISDNEKLKNLNITYAKYEENINYLDMLINNLEKYQIEYQRILEEKKAKKLLKEKSWWEIW
jgi:hypothetical protein